MKRSGSGAPLISIVAPELPKTVTGKVQADLTRLEVHGLDRLKVFGVHFEIRMKTDEV